MGISGRVSRRDELPTPALVLDVDALDRNIGAMIARTAAMGVALRPHAKAHKCVEVAQRLYRAGAVGACCATIAEAEAMARGGLPGILLTSCLVTPDSIERLSRLVASGADISAVVDSALGVDLLGQAAENAGRRIGVLVDIDVGVGRAGCVEIADIVALAQRIRDIPQLEYRGVQAYWGNLQQVMPFAERRSRVEVQAERLRSILAVLREAGLAPEIVSGSGTGTHAIDGRLGLFTEIQAGSFLFLDSCYGSVPTSDGEAAFEPSLYVAASVTTATRPGRVIVNAGLKAFATDNGKPMPMRGAPAGAAYRFMGDEHGALDFDGATPPLGATIEFLTSHCDPTVNLHSAYHVVSGESVVDVWPVVGRY
ncbi:MAG: DSD1 family PLP-dependent enzyme [Rhizobiaceae bacterium]|nr:DSD1 family PLP-dependent enzyme [Rhizobiaceae bacterium]